MKFCIAKSTFKDGLVFVEDFLFLIPFTNVEGQGFSKVVLLDFSNSEGEVRVLAGSEQGIDMFSDNK
jgi:hypothetical protein